VGGWPDTIGEDIVLTWAMRSRGYHILYDENAIVFTNVPSRYPGFFRQRKRWSRGLLEAFRRHPGVLWDFKMNSPFIYYNLTFPFVDFTYLCIFIPGVCAALFFGWYYLAGWITLALLPLAVIVNLAMFSIQKKTLKKHSLAMPKLSGGFLAYVLIYPLLITPATLSGYFEELTNRKERWGKK
jgi:biofilm PGA synthesis N-glycosyltransferase PgaC